MNKRQAFLVRSASLISIVLLLWSVPLAQSITNSPNRVKNLPNVPLSSLMAIIALMLMHVFSTHSQQEKFSVICRTERKWTL